MGGGANGQNAQLAAAKGRGATANCEAANGLKANGLHGAVGGGEPSGPVGAAAAANGLGANGRRAADSLPNIEDRFILNVSLEEPQLVTPCTCTEKAWPTCSQGLEEGREDSYFLSNIDRILMYTVETVHFFEGSSSSTKPPGDVGVIMKEGLERLLSGPYNFMAGRLRVDKESGRLDIKCNGKGALFAHAYAHHTLAELGDVSHPNFQFKKLVLQAFDVKSLEDLPLLLIQVTSFKCGGFVIGLGTNHTLVDGFAAVEFMENYAAIVRGEGLCILPHTDRTPLRARSPPRIMYPHHEFVRLQDLPPHIVSSFSDPSGGMLSSNLSGNMEPPTAHLFKSLYLPKTLIDRLKGKALQDGLLSTCSSFDVITALVWKARAKAIELEPHETSTAFFAVDLRARLKPSLPPHFCGNAVFSAHASATAEDLEEMPLSSCVRRIQMAVAAVTTDYVRSALDWEEVNHGVPAILGGCFFVAAWGKLAFQNVDFGWGKPFYCGPVVNGRVEFVLLLPHTTKDSCCIYLALEPHQMDKFEKLIYEP